MFGNPNSVDVHPSSRADEVAVAVGAQDKTQPVHVVFMSKNGEIKDSVEVGFLPDMLTYDHNGRRLVVANKGEPNDDYSVDPEGSVSIIETFGSSRRRVTNVGFGGLSETALVGVRISGPEGTTAAQDIEPEYVVFNEDDFSAVGSAGDLGPEGLDFVPASESPNGEPLLIVANEVSGTTTIYEITE